jgi:hypothetical protein
MVYGDARGSGDMQKVDCIYRVGALLFLMHFVYITYLFLLV